VSTCGTSPRPSGRPAASAAFLGDYVTGFEKSYVAQSGVNIGVRETRRIRGEYQLTAEDVLTARTFPDAVARGSYPVDIPQPQGAGTVLQNLPPERPTTSPCAASCQGVERLLVAGRCISGPGAREPGGREGATGRGRRRARWRRAGPGRVIVSAAAPRRPIGDRGVDDLDVDVRPGRFRRELVDL
jgi:hypothetical protein